ncbi:unnamed protein product [Clavelina lepadiformis]|uniref:ENTH domain-containing protein n=1 Tax=Clavelina lepadiformis TaxID=159417 RepID=A0ABP0G0V9_CLALP
MNVIPPLWKIREVADKVTNVVMNYSEVEARVREATNDEAWGPSGSLMQELARDTFMYECFPEVMGMLWKRMLHEGRKNWRRIYKSLLLLTYLIRNGSERVVTSAREHLYDLKSLQDFTCYDEHGKDQGVNVRNKVKEIVSLIQDNERLREERKKAKKNRDKYIGMSSDDARFQSGRHDFSPPPSPETSSQRRYRGGNTRGRRTSFDGEYRDSESQYDYGKTKTSANGSPPNNSTAYSDESAPSDSENENKYTKVHQDTSRNSDRQHQDIKRLNDNSGSKPAPRKPRKKVDLGAASNYTGNSSTNNTSIPPPIVTKAKPLRSTDNVDLLGELFSSAPSPSQAKSVDLFGEISSNQTNQTGNVEQFADFTGFQQSTASPNDQIFSSPASGQLDPFASLASSQSSDVNEMTSTVPLSRFVGFSSPQGQGSASTTSMHSANTGQSSATFQGFQSYNTAPLPASNAIFPQQSNVPFSQVASPDLMNISMGASFMTSTDMLSPQTPGSELSRSDQSLPSQTNQHAPSNKSNMWSDIKGVNISLDSLGKAKAKQAAPSMNQMQAGHSENLAKQIGGMNLSSPMMGPPQTNMITPQQRQQLLMMQQQQQHTLMMQGPQSSQYGLPLGMGGVQSNMYGSGIVQANNRFTMNTMSGPTPSQANQHMQAKNQQSFGFM